MRTVWKSAAMWLIVVLGTSEAGSYAEDVSNASVSASVRLELIKYSQFQEAIKSYAGKVVVVDIWALWCAPCRKEFHNIVELHKEFAKKGVVCISLSLDEPAQAKATLAFLRSQNAVFPNYLLDEGEAGWDLLKVKGIPAVLVFDRDGQLVRRFTGDDPDNQFTYADVKAFVEMLVRDHTSN